MTSGSPLAGHHAFITGGGSGIGLGTAKALMADGASVTICGRTEETLTAAVGELGDADAEGTAAYAIVDVADEDSVTAAVTAANERMPLTMGVANAGRGGAGPLLQLDAKSWEDTLRVNLTGTFFTFKHVGTALAANGGGSMCAVSSISGVRTHRLFGAYTAAKAGVNNLVENAADELGSLGIRVNGVAPGLVETDLSMALQTNEAVNEDYRLNMPLGRRGTVQDVASAIRFLLGPESSWITGVVVSVDGGHHLRRGPNIDPLMEGVVPDLPPISPQVD
jgi:NAD(P)-dependent dehydrogenase (short-subunit alcohol dehydrogenase family)